MLLMASAPSRTTIFKPGGVGCIWASPEDSSSHASSPVSVDAHALPVECPSSLLEEVCESALAESARQPHVALEFNGELFGKNLDVNYRVPFHHRRAEVCGVLFGNREETRVQ